MCKKTQFKYCPSTIDKCMRILIENIGDNCNTVACCCGHGKYPMTIVCEENGEYFDIVSNIEIPRTRKFYKKDKQGYYYIPECVKHKMGEKNVN